MAITLTAAYLAELKKKNTPNVVLEVALDSGSVKWGYHTGGFSDVAPILKAVSSLQNKLDAKSGFATRGEVTAVIVGRDSFKNLICDEYLKNRRVVRKEGFVSSGYAWSDYAETFNGKIIDWSRKGDKLTLVIADDMIDAAVKIPTENVTKTQYIDYTNSGMGKNPVDIMTDILLTELGIATGYVDSTQFTSERDLWLTSWLFSRVLTEPKGAKEYLNELQRETNSFIVHDGEKISFKVFAPPVPGQTIEEWTDDYNILDGSFSQKSGYKEHFFNRIVVYYDYDESGSDKEENFETGVISIDAASQGSGEWDEVKSKVVKSKWIRSFTHNQPSSMTGVVIYHASVNNGAGAGTLTFTYDATDGDTLGWTAPGGSAGDVVKITKSGKYQVFDADKTKWARVVVDRTDASFPTSNQSNTISITALNGSSYATTIAQKLLSRYRDPVGPVSFDVDINNVVCSSTFIKPTDFKDITTDEAAELGVNRWSLKRCILTSIRPDFSNNKVRVEAIDANMERKYAFIASAGQPDWDSATDTEKEYAYIGDAANNELGAANDPGFYHW